MPSGGAVVITYIAICVYQIMINDNLRVESIRAISFKIVI